MALRGSQPAVLRAIDESPKDPAGYVSDEQVSRLTQVAIDDVRDWLITLQDDGLVSLSRTTGGFRAFMEARGRIELGEHQERLGDRTKSAPAAPEKAQSKIRPKGLRAFDKEDADFFLELLPGPYDREGLPDGISFWKVRIEGKDPDRTFRVGVLYGPSGCGKSSLVKAGLLPRLPGHVLPVYVEATASETESRLLKGLRRRCPDLPPDLGLTDSVVALYEGLSPSSGKKILLVIDQFEQWLLAKGGEKGTGLVEALRHCDEERVQAIVMVRDDFLSSTIQFMDELGIEFRPSLNTRRVDLFGRPHAKEVLAVFGQSYGVLGEDLTPDEQTFLNHAVDGLAREGIIIPVRLALFAEMLKSREWTPKTLEEIGGTEGVGVAFLEETFSSSYADPRHRTHQEAARCVLKAMLPEGGPDIRGPKRSRGELLKASGYASQTDRYDDLIGILDSELRLITPTALEDLTSEHQPTSPPGDPYYQLTHDYLVPSIREWLTRKQRETRRGRAELRLADRSAIWAAKPENRHLPSLLEWANIRLLTKSKDWTNHQRNMMERAGRVHGVRGLTLVAVLLLLGWAGNEVSGRLKAQMLRDKLLGSPLAGVPGIIAELEPYRRWIDPLLRQAYAEANEAGNSQKQLKAALALLPVDDMQLAYLKDRLLHADAQDIPVIRRSLAGHKDALVDECWRVLESPEPGDRGKVLRSASALAIYDPKNPIWGKICIDVANRLVAENAYVVAHWIDALRPVGNQLREPLTAVFHDEKRGESERTLAAGALAEYVNDQPDELGELLMDATEKQFAVLYPRVEIRSDQTAPILEVELGKKPPFITGGEPTDVDNRAWDKFYKRQANAAVALIRMGRLARSWILLKHSPDPSLRSYLVHRLGPLGFEAGLLIDKLDQESDVSIRRALILCLGEYGEVRLSTTERNVVTKKLLNLYRNDPDPGIHGAADWLLRQWRNDNQIIEIDKELARLPLPTLRVDQGAVSSQANNRRWYVNSQGQTMVIVRGPVEFNMGEGESRHRERIDQNFAIAAKEVTVEQFQRFLRENPRIQIKNYEVVSPEPTCPMSLVSWCDAAAYCNWSNKQDGIPEDQWCYGPNQKGYYAEGMKLVSNAENRRGYRLPSDAEWEISCRAGAVTGYFFGEPWELLEKYGWYIKNSPNRTLPVGRLKPNDLGLFDLHGNLWEWCQDRYYKEPGKEDKGQDMEISEGNANKDSRILRGGTFDIHPLAVRSAFRFGFGPAVRNSDSGFRPSRTYP